MARKAKPSPSPLRGHGGDEITAVEGAQFIMRPTYRVVAEEYGEIHFEATSAKDAIARYEQYCRDQFAVKPDDEIDITCVQYIGGVVRRD